MQTDGTQKRWMLERSKPKIKLLTIHPLLPKRISSYQSEDNPCHPSVQLMVEQCSSLIFLDLWSWFPELYSVRSKSWNDSAEVLFTMIKPWLMMITVSEERIWNSVKLNGNLGWNSLLDQSSPSNIHRNWFKFKTCLSLQTSGIVGGQWRCFFRYMKGWVRSIDLLLAQDS